MLSTYAPHYPSTAAPDDKKRFTDYKYRAPVYTDMTGKPDWVKKAATFKFPWPPAGSARDDQEITNYIRTLASVDRSIKAIIDKISDLGQSEKTIVIFSSDNGLLWGEHGLSDKGMPYDPSIQVPLIVKMPRAKPAINNSLIAMNLDIPATIYDLAKISEKTDGQSLVPALLGVKKQLREEILIESYGYLDWWNSFGFNAAGLGIWSGIRTDQWKFIEHPTGEKELYNLDSDPNEFVNEYNNPEYKSVRKKMENKHNSLRGIGK